MTSTREGLVQPHKPPTQTLTPLRVEPRPAQGSIPHLRKKAFILRLRLFVFRFPGTAITCNREGLVQPHKPPTQTLTPLRVEPRPAQGSIPHLRKKAFILR